METINGDEERYNILEEVGHIVDGLHFAEDKPPQPGIEITKKRLRAVMVELYGLRWTYCDIDAHVTSGGETMYTASLRCKQCRKIHVYLAKWRDGGFEFAATIGPDGE